MDRTNYSSKWLKLITNTNLKNKITVNFKFINVEKNNADKISNKRRFNFNKVRKTSKQAGLKCA